MKRKAPSTFGERLKLAREALGLTQERLGEIIDVAERNVRCYEAGTKRPATARLPDIARATHRDVGWFFGGPTRVPLYDEVPAGPSLEPVHDAQTMVAVPDEWVSGDARVYCLRVRGTSMAPLLMHGDLIVVRAQPDAENGQIVVATLANGEYVVKRHARKRDGRVMLASLNRDHADITTDAHTRINGRVIGVIRSL